MSVEARTPVVVGVGDVTHRGDDFVDPIDLAVEAARRAVRDAGRAVERRIDTVATPGILVIPRDNPASRIAEAMRIGPPAASAVRSAETPRSISSRCWVAK
ncbi:acetyl-CoA acetyltransferase [Mycobacteroides abscessus]|nr:acetyl-CoA acetyltransferase [Mycobacteroides abscessus]